MGCGASSSGAGLPAPPGSPRHRAPGTSAPYLRKAEGLAAQGKLREAAGCMQEAVGLDPSNGRLHTLLGEMMKRAGMPGFLAEFKLGAETPHPVSEAERANGDASRAASCVRFAAVLAEGHDDVTQAFDVYEEAHRLDPMNAEAYVERAWLLWELEDRSDADSAGERSAALKSALAIEPSADGVVMAAAHAQLANILLQKGRRKDAVQHARQALQLDEGARTLLRSDEAFRFEDEAQAAGCDAARPAVAVS